MATTMTDVSDRLICPICETRGEIEMRGNRRCYGVGLLVMTEADGTKSLSPDGWNHGEPDFEEVYCNSCENELDEQEMLKQLEEAPA